MSTLLPLPGSSNGPKSTTCEVRRWVTVTVAEALANNEPSVPTAFHSDDKMPGTPSGPNNPLCDVRRWVVISVDEALRRPDDFRCVECKLPVRAHHASVDGMAAHFEHKTRNPRCTRSDSR